MSTPYDGKVGLWQWTGQSVGEATIDQLVQTIKTNCPVADAVWVKTNDGSDWQGIHDSKTTMAINGPQDITKWVNTLTAAGLEFHAWCVPNGVDPASEAARIVEVCQVPGVKSMVLDVEPYTGFWQGTAQTADALMSAVRSKLGPNFHIGLSMDPRRAHYDAISPNAWQPYVNSLHPQVYWDTMGRTPDDLLAETYSVWGAYGLPIIPALSGGAPPDSIKTAQDLARSVRGAPGVSYWRLGVIGPMQFNVINQEVVGQEIGPDHVLRTYGSEQIISPGDPGYMDGTQTGQPTSAVFKQYTSARGQLIKYKPTGASQDTVWAQWNPSLPGSGLYEVSVYVPGRHATTTQARYHIHGVSGVASELLVRLNQNLYYDVWVPLVVYDFDGNPGSGQVNLTDLTGEPDKEIAFTAIRWRKVETQEKVVTAAGVGFDPPIGTATERLSTQVWPGKWFDATGFAVFYTTVGPAYHTGADLNLPGDVDRDTPVYAAAGGIVTFSGRSSGSWGQLIVVRHDPLPDGTVVWSRYAHVENRIVQEGNRVERGQQIAQVGNADGALPYHLHFDVAKTSVLETNPAHWPGNNLTGVLNNYTDPRQWIIDHRPPGR